MCVGLVDVVRVILSEVRWWSKDRGYGTAKEGTTAGGARKGDEGSVRRETRPAATCSWEGERERGRKGSEISTGARGVDGENLPLTGCKDPAHHTLWVVFHWLVQCFTPSRC